MPSPAQQPTLVSISVAVLGVLCSAAVLVVLQHSYAYLRACLKRGGELDDILNFELYKRLDDVASASWVGHSSSMLTKYYGLKVRRFGEKRLKVLVLKRRRYSSDWDHYITLLLIMLWKDHHSSLNEFASPAIAVSDPPVGGESNCWLLLIIRVSQSNHYIGTFI